MVPEDDELPVQLFHTSLRDFLTTQARSQHLFMNPVSCHLSVVIDCLAVMTAHHHDIFYEIGILEYAAMNWCDHLLSAIEEGGGSDLLLSQNNAFLNTLIDFVSRAFDPWINSFLIKVEIEDTMETFNSILQVSVMHC